MRPFSGTTFSGSAAIGCRRRILLVMVAVAVASSSVATAQSLWNSRVPKKSFLFYDTQARQVGDILTVLIEESTDVNNRDQRQLDRDSESSGGFSLTGTIGGDLGTKAGNSSLDASTKGSGRFGGTSAYTVDRGFSDRITVTVVQQLPNGNLVIRGSRNRVVSGERRALRISGVIRPIDVRSDNVIESQYIANFRICYDGDGIESRFTEEGWMTRAWNKFRPF